MEILDLELKILSVTTIAVDDIGNQDVDFLCFLLRKACVLRSTPPVKYNFVAIDWLICENLANYSVLSHGILAQ